MTWDPNPTFTNLQTLLQNTGNYAAVWVGEPFSPPDPDLVAAIFMYEAAPGQTTLSTTIDVRTLMVRLYARAGMTPADAERVERAVDLAESQLEATLAANFTLGGTVRAIDWAGEEAGHHVSAKWGHLVLAGTIFRVVDFLCPLIVDDSSVFKP